MILDIKYFLAAFSGLLIIRTVSGSPYKPTYNHTGSSNYTVNPGNDTTPDNSTMAKDFTPIVGEQDIHPRLPIDKLRTEQPDVWNMFILALASLQAVPQSNDTSYYGVAGIHGMPHVGWQYPQHTDDLGYCVHGSILFTYWHRPYLILLEQQLVRHAIVEADKFDGDQKDLYQEAARKVRLPYWDWASDDTKSWIPAVMQQDYISVVQPGQSGSTPIQNPLRAYIFKGGIKPQNTPTQRTDISAWLNGAFPGRKAATLQLFTLETYNEFGTRKGSERSVEGIHDDVHVTFGEHDGNTMGPVDESAFDPIFWLHHCNVDRLMAMYQATHPDAVMTPMEGYGVMGRPEGGSETLQTPLYPFRHTTKTDEWTANDVKDVKSIFHYGYYYPEVPADLADQPDQLRIFTLKKVSELYEPHDLELPPPGAPSPTNPPTNISTTATATSVSETDQPTESAKPGTTVRTEWQAAVVFDASQITGSFSVSLYFGDAEDTITPKSLVGATSSFSMKSQKMEGENIISGLVPLTPAMLETKVGLDKDTAVPWLKDNLHWKVLGAGNKEKDIGTLSTLNVTVNAASVTYFAAPEKLPEYGDNKPYSEITKGKEGGAKQ